MPHCHVRKFKLIINQTEWCVSSIHFDKTSGAKRLLEITESHDSLCSHQTYTLTCNAHHRVYYTGNDRHTRRPEDESTTRNNKNTTENDIKFTSWTKCVFLFEFEMTISGALLSSLFWFHSVVSMWHHCYWGRWTQNSIHKHHCVVIIITNDRI